MQTKTPFEDRLLGLLGPAAGDMDFSIVRLRVMGGSGRKRLQVMAERPDGTMGVEDCATLSRGLSAVLEVSDPFDAAWDLEVSSPGIDRPLTQLDHFSRWQGFEAKIELDRLIDFEQEHTGEGAPQKARPPQKRFFGVLAGVEDDAVLLDTAELEDGDTSMALPFDWIVDARLVLTDALIAESLRRGAAQPADTLPEDVERDVDDQLVPDGVPGDDEQTKAGGDTRTGVNSDDGRPGHPTPFAGDVAPADCEEK